MGIFFCSENGPVFRGSNTGLPARSMAVTIDYAVLVLLSTNNAETNQQFYYLFTEKNVVHSLPNLDLNTDDNDS